MLSLKDVMTMTSLSERTIRRYLETGQLEGTKVGGVWRFTQEQLEGFYEYGKGMKTLRKQATNEVLDFINMPNPEKLGAKACVMIDLIQDEEIIEQAKQMVMKACNEVNGPMTMKFLKEQDNYRFILTGPLDFISDVTLLINELVAN